MPAGDVNGITLDQGTEVHVPPDQANQLNSLAPIGARIQVSGWIHTGPLGDTHLDATTITGAVRSFNYGPAGEVNGLIMDRGTVVYFPPEQAAQITQLAQVGTRIRVRGSLRQGSGGNALIAAESITDRRTGNSISVADQPLQH